MLSEWSPDRVDLLKKLWLEGLSASQIAGILGGGITRNSVIGKKSRLKLPDRLAGPRRSSIYRPIVAATAPRPRAAVKPKTIFAREKPAPLGALPPDITVNAAAMRAPVWGLLPGTKGVRLVDHHEGQCRWPIGDALSPEFIYCGQPVYSEGKPYCAVHKRHSVHAQ